MESLPVDIIKLLFVWLQHDSTYLRQITKRYSRVYPQIDQTVRHSADITTWGRYDAMATTLPRAEIFRCATKLKLEGRLINTVPLTKKTMPSLKRLTIYNAECILHRLSGTDWIPRMKVYCRKMPKKLPKNIRILAVEIYDAPLPAMSEVKELTVTRDFGLHPIHYTVKKLCVVPKLDSLRANLITDSFIESIECTTDEILSDFPYKKQTTKYCTLTTRSGVLCEVTLGNICDYGKVPWPEDCSEISLDLGIPYTMSSLNDDGTETITGFDSDNRRFANVYDLSVLPRKFKRICIMHNRSKMPLINVPEAREFHATDHLQEHKGAIKIVLPSTERLTEFSPTLEEIVIQHSGSKVWLPNIPLPLQKLVIEKLVVQNFRLEHLREHNNIRIGLYHIFVNPTRHVWNSDLAKFIAVPMYVPGKGGEHLDLNSDWR